VQARGLAKRASCQFNAWIWGRLGRAGTVAITDASRNGLNSQSVTNFGGGVYLVWIVSGHVEDTSNMTDAVNAVATGLFFH
jgi:hypothetical protein